MSGVKRLENRQLSDDAIDWLVLLHSGAAAPRDHAAFARWRRKSPAHDAAAEEAEALWQEIGETAAARTFVPGAGVAGSRSIRISRRGLLAGMMTASVGGLAFSSGIAGPAAGLLADYRTARGERRREHLPDGSTVWLNTQTALSASYTASERRLTLYAGEALFDVRRDRARPFVVEAGGGQARALGTRYAIRHNGAAIDVDVVEGSVSVGAGGGEAPRTLTADHRTRFADGRFLMPVSTVDAFAVTAWQRGKLIFNRQPLRQVVAELQRYRYGRILLVDDEFGAMPVTGVFDLDDDDATLSMLQELLPIEVTRLPLLTVLRRAS